jgi:hypothetical protein
MAAVTVRLDLSKLQAIERLTPGRASDLVMELALMTEKDVKESMGSGPPGRSYTRGGKTHVASKPGYPPAVDTGTLSNSYQSQRRGRFAASLSSDQEHALYMEYGAPAANIAPRPHLLPAVERTAQRARRGGLLKKVITG